MRAGERLRRVGRRLAAPYRERGLDAIAWTLRLTIAAVASFVVARLSFPASGALLAPLTALLVVQLTPVSLLSSGLDRVLSVLAGVGVAVVFASLVELTWWSLAIVIAVSLLIAIGLRLGNNALEVPISAMLIMGVGHAVTDIAAWERIAVTLIGAAVGVACNLLVPPRVADREAERAIDGLAARLADILEESAADVEKASQQEGDVAGRISYWLGRMRALTHGMPDVGYALLRAEESRRLNVRALGTPDIGPVLRRAVETLEHTSVSIRTVYRTLEDIAYARDRAPQELRRDVDVLALGMLLRELAQGVRAFGVQVSAEATPGAPPPDGELVRDAVEQLGEARARLTELSTAGIGDDLAFAELTFALLTTVERIARELDLEGRQRRLEERARPPTRRAVVRARSDEWLRPTGDLAKRAIRRPRPGQGPRRDRPR